MQLTPNLWQYLVLLEGLATVALSAGIATEALRRHPLRILGYANLGVALISLSGCANVVANIESAPTLATWIAAAGFAIYVIAVVGSWLHAHTQITWTSRLFPL